MGRDVVPEHRFLNERPERFVSLAQELVDMKVDVLVAVSMPNAASQAGRSVDRPKRGVQLWLR